MYIEYITVNSRFLNDFYTLTIFQIIFPINTIFHKVVYTISCNFKYFVALFNYIKR